MKTKISIVLTAFLLIITSCNRKEKEDSIMTKDEASVSAKIDLANDDVSSIIEDQYDNINSDVLSNKNGETTFSSCAVITRNPAFGNALTVGQTVTKTIDFGTGCNLTNGNHLSGKIIMTFVYQPSATSHSITYSFDNFYHNYIKIDGTKTFTRTMTIATAASPSHPIVVMNMDLTATFPNGSVHQRVGSRTREIVEGYNTGTFLDNIYKVTGSWTTTHPDSTVISEITTPLLVKISCMNTNKPLLVQGIITFTKNNNSSTLNYGSGACDNLAVFTINGNSYDIVIGN